MEQQQQCQGPQADGSITVEEAAAALASMPRGKSPGSDGFTYEFYGAFWDMLGEPMVAAFNYSFSQQQQQQQQQQQPLPQQQQQQQQQHQLSARQRLGLITLIHKGGGKPRESPDSYRPITLLQCDVKVMAKVLVNRLSPVLGSVIDGTQTAFVPGRTAADNVLLHLEEIDYVRGQQQPGCIVFLDFFKAYDRLDRGWVLRCMEAMAFPSSAISWVRLLLAGTQGSISFNGGHRSRVFDIPSGCAQGSPLSPLLYVIAAQPLAARCRALQAAGQFSSILLPDGAAAPPIHQHADDTSLHAATNRDVQVLLQHAVQPFCAASGALLSASKCEGLTLGSHQQISGVDQVTGIPFPDTTQQPIRHLGLLLSRDGAMSHAQQLYTERLRSVTWRVRQWAQHHLSLQGRCEVAKQVLASTFTYHCQFLPVPPLLLSLIHRRILWFVAGKGCPRQDQLRQLSRSPPAAVAALPTKMGGIGQVDIRAHTAAMQAKVAAAALHPRRAAWKQFFAANLQRQLPGLGLAALVQQSHHPTSQAKAQGRLGARHAAYIDAFRQAGPRRQLPHAYMQREQIGLELLVGNYSVGSPADGSMLPSAGSIPSGMGSGPGARLRGALPLLQQQQQQQAGAAALVLPPAWWSTLQQPGAVTAWHTDPHQQWVRLSAGGGDVAFRVQQDGSLTPVEGVPGQAAAGPWLPCCVVDVTEFHLPASLATTAARWARRQLQQQSGQQQQQPAEQQQLELFLVGPFASVAVDPSVWGFGGGIGVLQFTVRHATQRLLQLQCARQLYPGWEPGVGMRPRLWRDAQGREAPAAGLRQLEAGQKRSFEAMLAAGGVVGGSGGGSSSSAADVSAFATPAQMAAYHASWMDASPPRLHPRQRVAAAAAAVTTQRQQQVQQHAAGPAVDDTWDPVLGFHTGRAICGRPWVAAYRRAAHKQLPRRLREFGWRLLHASTRVGARRMHVAPAGTPVAAFACQHQQCQQQQPLPPLATLSHVFITCPVAVVVLKWFARVWQQVQPGALVNTASSRIMLLDDHQVWAPPSQKAALWTFLRLLLLESLHVVMCRQAGQQQQQQGQPAQQQQQQQQHQQQQRQQQLHQHQQQMQQQQQQQVPCYTSRVAVAVASRFRVELQRQMQLEWRRVDHDVRQQSGLPMAWLRGPSPVISRRAFNARWRGLVTFSADDTPTLAVTMAGLG